MSDNTTWESWGKLIEQGASYESLNDFASLLRKKTVKDDIAKLDKERVLEEFWAALIISQSLGLMFARTNEGEKRTPIRNAETKAGRYRDVLIEVLQANGIQVPEALKNGAVLEADDPALKELALDIWLAGGRPSPFDPRSLPVPKF